MLCASYEVRHGFKRLCQPIPHPPSPTSLPLPTIKTHAQSKCRYPQTTQSKPSGRPVEQYRRPHLRRRHPVVCMPRPEQGRWSTKRGGAWNHKPAISPCRVSFEAESAEWAGDCSNAYHDRWSGAGRHAARRKKWTWTMSGRPGEGFRLCCRRLLETFHGQLSAISNVRGPSPPPRT